MKTKTTEKRSPFDVPHANECQECQGRGYTRATAPEMRNGETVAIGSGCPECFGTGRTQ